MSHILHLSKNTNILSKSVSTIKNLKLIHIYMLEIEANIDSSDFKLFLEKIFHKQSLYSKSLMDGKITNFLHDNNHFHIELSFSSDSEQYWILDSFFQIKTKLLNHSLQNFEYYKIESSKYSFTKNN
jgi:hypothetical protein